MIEGQDCKHRRCRYLAVSAQMECYCGHAKEQHRRGGRHKCDGTGATSWNPRHVRTWAGSCDCLAFIPRIKP
jgi:hypothetical protein